MEIIVLDDGDGREELDIIADIGFFKALRTAADEVGDVDEGVDDIESSAELILVVCL